MEFEFSDIGEGITEGEIVRWHVKEGDYVEENDTIVEVETDKAIVDLPSPASGIVTSVKFDVGDTVDVGETLVEIDEDSDLEDSQTSDEQGEDDSGTVVGEISSEKEVVDDEDETSDRSEEESVLATPATRKLANDLGVDLTEVQGSGKQGRITKEDVKKAAEGEPRKRQDQYGEVVVEPLRGVRKSVAEKTETSAEEIPQVTHMDRADVTELYDLMQQKREEIDEYKITLSPFFIRALVESLKEFPVLNTSISMEDDEIRYKKYYNIGVTVDTEDGLIVPVVKNADTMDVREIGSTVNELARRCRSREIDLEELRGATFTLTNIGFVGGRWATPQVNHPEVGIMATGRAEKTPVVRDDEVVVRRMLPVSLSFDHRVLDGAEAARFTNHFISQLENPEFT